MNVYDFTVVDGLGQNVSLKEYEGKVLLIINSATGCGFTPQYDELEDIYEEFKDQGFEILDFPCNQFGNQAPGSDEEIQDFCNSRYGIQFPIFHKVEVNGENAETLFKYLKDSKSFSSKSFRMKLLGKLSKTSKNENDIRWNFTKFLVNRKGEVVKRIEPVEDVKKIREDIKGLL